jgi:hypothetical protein
VRASAFSAFRTFCDRQSGNPRVTVCEIAEDWLTDSISPSHNGISTFVPALIYVTLVIITGMTTVCLYICARVALKISKTRYINVEGTGDFL